LTLRWLQRILKLGRQTKLTTINHHGRREFGDAVRSGAVRHEEEREVIDPMTATFVRGSSHLN
jgi:hypothetical protein